MQQTARSASIRGSVAPHWTAGRATDERYLSPTNSRRGVQVVAEERPTQAESAERQDPWVRSSPLDCRARNGYEILISNEQSPWCAGRC